jgi:hypothetical protein
VFEVMPEGNCDWTWFRKAWPLLLVRWAVFAALIAGISMAQGQDAASAALLGVLVGGVMNVAWQCVA